MGRTQSAETRERIQKSVIAQKKAAGIYTGAFILRATPCKHCGHEFLTNSLRKKYCSVSCRGKRKQSAAAARAKLKSAVTSYRKRQKLRAIAHKGGVCEGCGYSRYAGALHFHHRDPSQKDIVLSGNSMSWEKMVVELEKCALLCANCHSEVHGGIRILPSTTTGSGPNC